jgi:hypothetical protein
MVDAPGKFIKSVITYYLHIIKIVICTTSYESHTFFHEFAD